MAPTEIETSARCTWCGLPSGGGATCESCGSPVSGGYLLEEDERPQPHSAPQRGTGTEETALPDPTKTNVACTWCGQVTAPGPTCDVCGSPLVGGNVLTLPDIADDEPMTLRPRGSLLRPLPPSLQTKPKSGKGEPEGEEPAAAEYKPGASRTSARRPAAAARQPIPPPIRERAPLRATISLKDAASQPVIP